MRYQLNYNRNGFSFFVPTFSTTSDSPDVLNYLYSNDVENYDDYEFDNNALLSGINNFKTICFDEARNIQLQQMLNKNFTNFDKLEDVISYAMQTILICNPSSIISNAIIGFMYCSINDLNLNKIYFQVDYACDKEIDDSLVVKEMENYFRLFHIGIERKTKYSFKMRLCLQESYKNDNLLEELKQKLILINEFKEKTHGSYKTLKIYNELRKKKIQYENLQKEIGNLENSLNFSKFIDIFDAYSNCEYDFCNEDVYNGLKIKNLPRIIRDSSVSKNDKIRSYIKEAINSIKINDNLYSLRNKFIKLIVKNSDVSLISNSKKSEKVRKIEYFSREEFERIQEAIKSISPSYDRSYTRSTSNTDQGSVHNGIGILGDAGGQTNDPSYVSFGIDPL